MLQRLATLVLPTAMALTAVLWAPDDWRATAFISLFWFALAWGHGYFLSSNAALLLGAGMWIALQPDVTAAFFAALLPLALLSAWAMFRAGTGRPTSDNSELAPVTARNRSSLGGRGAG